MFKNIFIWLSRKLYPSGWVFRMPTPLISDSTYVTEDYSDDYTTEDGDTLETEEREGEVDGGILHRLHEAIGTVQAQTWQDGLSILDSCVADNPNFTIDDANDWYRRLGIFNSGLVSLSDMMKAINQKINYPGEKVFGRSNYLFIQEQLRNAGFDVYVYENRFLPGPVTKTPSEVLGIGAEDAEYGEELEYGESEYGDTFAIEGITKVVNYLEEEKDDLFIITDVGWRSTFYIAGATITTFANVPASRKFEFRQLVLQLKPTQCPGILFVIYV